MIEPGVNSKQCENCFQWKYFHQYEKIPKIGGGVKKDCICIECKIIGKGSYFNSKCERQIRKDKRVSKKQNKFNSYNLTIDDYVKLYTNQKGCCKICGINQSDLKRKLCVDHCHETGIVRGLLCSKCNIALGMLNDNIENLKSSIKYLEESEERVKIFKEIITPTN